MKSEALRKALHLGKINLLGHSFGGLTAQAFAIKYPGSVNKLILSNTIISSKAYQELTDNFNDEVDNFFPEIGEKVKVLRNRGYKSSSPEHQSAYLEKFANSFNYFFFYNPCQ